MALNLENFVMQPVTPMAGVTVGGPSTEQAVSITDVICEGPIQGLVNGLGSVYLNDTAIQQTGNNSFRPLVTNTTGRITFSGTTGTCSSDTTIPSGLTVNSATPRKITLKNYLTAAITLSTDANGFTVATRALGTFTTDWTTNSADKNVFLVSDKGTWRASFSRIDNTTGFIFLHGGNAAELNLDLSSSYTLNMAQSFTISAVTDTTVVTTTAPNAGTYEFQIEEQSALEPSVGGAAATLKKYEQAHVDFRDGSLYQDPIPPSRGIGGATTIAGSTGGINLAELKQLKSSVASSLGLSSFMSSTAQYPDGQSNTNDGAAAASIMNPSDFGLDTQTKIDEADLVYFSIRYSALINTKNENGDKMNAYARYKMEIQTTLDGVTTDYVNPFPSQGDVIQHTAMRTAAVDFQHIISLEQFRPFDTFKVRVSRLTRHVGSAVMSGGADFNTDKDKSTISGAATLINLGASFLDKFNYPYTAHAQTVFSTKKLNNVPKITYELRGLKVQIPTTYTPREYTAFGVEAEYKEFWDGTLTTKLFYTDNPAWIFYDIITNRRYGAGDWIYPDDIDIYALYRVARYCDELVRDGKEYAATAIEKGKAYIIKSVGTTDYTTIGASSNTVGESFVATGTITGTGYVYGAEPRFRMNLFLTKATDVYKVLKDMASMFTSMIYWMDGKLSTIIDAPSDPVYNFTKGNVIDGKFDYESSGVKTRTNQCIVTWNDPANNYKPSPIVVEDRESIVRTGRIISQNAVAFGATSEGQAIRYGKWKLFTAQNQVEIANFKTSLAAGFIRPGDIVNIQDADRSGNRFSGRVSNLTDPTAGLTLANTITATNRIEETETGFSNTNRAQNVVMSARVQLLKNFSAPCILFEMGGTGNGLYVGISSESSTADSLLFRVSDGASNIQSTTADNLYMTVPINKIPQFDDGMHTVTWDITLSSGRARLWIDNILYMDETTSSGSFHGFEWAGSDDGAFGSASLSNVAGSESNNAWEGTVETLKVYNNQIVDGTWVNALNTITFDAPVSFVSSSTYELSTLVTESAAFYTGAVPVTINGVTYSQGDKVNQAYVYVSNSYSLQDLNTAARASNAFADSSGSELLPLVWKPYSYIETNSITNPGASSSTATIASGGSFNRVPAPETIWALTETQSGLETTGSKKLYKVLSVKDSGENVYSISAVEHYNEKYAAIEKDYELSVIPPTIYADEPTDPPAPLNLFVSLLLNKKNPGQHLRVDWEAPESDYIAGYEIHHNIPGSNDPVIHINNNTTEFLFENLQGGEYTIRVRTVSTSGNYSDFMSTTYVYDDIFDENIARMPLGIPKGAISTAVGTLESDVYTFPADARMASLASPFDPVVLSGVTQDVSTIAANVSYYLLLDHSVPDVILVHLDDSSLANAPFYRDIGTGNTGVASSMTSIGTVSIGANTSKLTGSGTSFLTDLRVGDTLNLSNSTSPTAGDAAVITAIADDTNLTLDRGFTTAKVSITGYRAGLRLDATKDAIFARVLKTGTNIALENFINTNYTFDNSTVTVNSGGTISIADGGVDTQQIAANAVTTAEIESQAITSALLESTLASTISSTAVQVESLSAALGSAESAASAANAASISMVAAEAAQNAASIHQAAVDAAASTVSSAKLATESARTAASTFAASASAFATSASAFATAAELSKNTASADKVAASAFAASASAFATASEASKNSASAHVVTASSFATSASADATSAASSASSSLASASTATVQAAAAASSSTLAANSRSAVDVAQIEAQMVLANLMPSIVKAPTTSWADDPWTASGGLNGDNTVLNDQSFHGSFVTNDATFGEAFVFTAGDNAAFGPSQLLPYDDNKVYRMTVQHRVSTDNSQGSSVTRFTLGFTEFTDGSSDTSNDNVQPLFIDRTSSQGAQTSILYVSRRDLSGVTGYIQSASDNEWWHQSSTSSSNTQIGFQVRNLTSNTLGGSGAQNGANAVHEILVEDVTAVIDAIQQADAAAGSASAALSSSQAAASSRSSASASATAAENSRQSASTQAANAANSSSSAVAAKETASTAAASAASSETIAVNAKNSASADAIASANSASAALSSSQAAAASKSSASASATAAEASRQSASTQAANAANSSSSAVAAKETASSAAANAASSATLSAAARDAIVYQNYAFDGTFPDSTKPQWVQNTSEWSISTDYAKFGSNSLKADGTTTTSLDIFQSNAIPDQFPAVSIGDTWTWGCWVYIDGSGTSTETLGLAGDGGWATATTSTRNQWVFLTATDTAANQAANSTGVRLELRSSPLQTSDTAIYIDGVIVVKGDVDLTAVSVDDTSVKSAYEAGQSASAALSSSQAAAASKSSASASATAAENSRQSASTQAANAANSSSSAVAAKETASTAAAAAASSATLSATARDAIVAQNLVGDSDVTIDGLLRLASGEGWVQNYFERSSTQAKNGTYSAKAKTALFSDQFAEIYNTKVPMNTGDKFTWSAWVYKDFSTNITLQFQQFGGWAADTVNTTNQWQFVTGTGTVPTGTGVGTDLIVDIRGHDSLSSGGIFIDNLTVVRGDQDLSTILTDDSATTNRMLGVESESSTAASASAALSSAQAAAASKSSASASATAAENSRQSASTQATNAANSSSSAVVAKETASTAAASAASSQTIAVNARDVTTLNSQGISNAGFEFGETGVDTVPTGWEAEGQRSDFPNDMQFFTTPVNTNSSYGSTQSYGASNNASSGHWIRLSKYFLASPSQTFTASLDVYLEDTTANANNRDPEWIDEDDVFKIYNWYDADGALLSQTAVSSATSQYNQDNTSWVSGSSKAPFDTWFTYTSATATAPANTEYVRIDLILVDDQPGNSGSDTLVNYASWANGGNFRGLIDDFVLTSSGGVVEVDKGTLTAADKAAAAISSSQAAAASKSSASAFAATASSYAASASTDAASAANSSSSALVSRNTASTAAAAAASSQTIAVNARDDSQSAAGASANSASAALSSAQAAEASKSSASASAAAAEASRLAASTAQTAAEAAESNAVNAKNTASSAAASATNSESLTATALANARTELAAIGEYLFVNKESWQHTPQSYNLGTDDHRLIGNSTNMTDTGYPAFFVTNDSEFTNAYVHTKGLNDSVGHRKVYTYGSDKVWLLRMEARVLDDGDTISNGVYGTLGINGWKTDGTRITSDPDLNNTQNFTWTQTVSDGVFTRAAVYAGSDYTDSELEALTSITNETTSNGSSGRVHIVGTGTNYPPAYVGFQIRHNASSNTDGQLAIGSFEVIDITESVKAELQAEASSDSASAANTSANSASASNTAAGNSASAANASKLAASAAETAAELAESNAVNAKNTASSAAASASSSKVLAASSATTAGNSASAAEAARDSMVLHNYAYNGDAAKDELPAYFQSNRWETSTAQAKVGSRSFRLTSSGLTQTNPDIFLSTNATDFPSIASGDKFTWGAWVYVDGSDTGNISFGFAGDGGWATASTGTRNAWVFVTASGSAGTYPVSNQLVNLELRENLSTSHPNDNNVYIDDLQVVAGEVDLTTVTTTYGASQGSYEAALSASAANTSESNAATSASSASASAAAANSSALAASASEGNSANSQTAAANSASAANTSKESASASQTAAANSASAANSSRLAASAQFTAAQGQASAAANSAGAANDSASTAAASASAAGASASAANSSRLAASSQATASGNSASAALVSKQSASSFATDAASSAAAAIFDGKLLEARVTSGLNGHYADSDWFLCHLGGSGAPAYVVSYVDNINIYLENMVSGTVYTVKTNADKYTNYNIPSLTSQSGTGPWRVFASGPIVCKHPDGYMGAPANFSGQFLGQYANRYQPLDIYLFSPNGKATVDVYYDESLTGFNENSSVHHTITIPDGGYYLWEQQVDASSSQTSGSTTFLFKSDIKISGIFKPNGGDYQLMVPLSNGEVVGNDYSNNNGYPYFDNNATNTTVTNTAADSGARYYVNDDENFWFMSSNTADGGGGDAEFAIPRQGLSDYYIWPEPDISNFRIVSVEPAEIVVMKADGTVLYNVDHTAASTTAPLFYTQGTASGNNNFDTGGGPYRFVGTAPFHVVAQEGGDDDETTLLGARQAKLDEGSGAIKAIAQQSLTLTSAVDSNVTTISAQATTINGLEGQYTVKIDNNNHVSGFGLASTNTNGTPTSAFIIRADRFAVVDPTSSGSLTTSPDTADIPFEIVGGVTKIKNANVGSLSAGNVAADAIRASQLQISAASDATNSSMFFDGTNNVIKVYDSSGNLRVKFGNLS